MHELSLAIVVLNLLIVALILADARRARRRAERLRCEAELSRQREAERLRDWTETERRQLSCGQWCMLHDQHMDDPSHPYTYPDCERRLRRATAAEEAELSRRQRADNNS